MKKLFLALIICCFGTAVAQAAAVSGIVSSTTTCGPISGQKVFLADSFNVVYDSAVTNSSGFYSITFPSSWTMGKAYQLNIYACGSVYSNTGTYTGNATINPFICGSPKIIYGNIMLGSTVSSGPAKVYLIKIQNNYPTAGDTTLTAVDSSVITTGGTYMFTRPCTPTDTFLIKAMLMPGHTSYTSYLPSYDSSLSWSGANRRYAYHWSSSPSSGQNIYMFAGTNPGGPGFIGGSVLVGANKGTAVGDPLAGRLMILSNATTNKPVAYTYSDAAGKYSFANIAYGTYKLFGDAWGLFNVPYTVTISAATPSINNIVFEENYISNTFKAKHAQGVPTTSALSGAAVYPNPATLLVTISGISHIRGSKTAVLTNLVGAEVASQTFADGAPVSLSTSTLPAGTYILRLFTDAGAASFKVVK